MRRIVKMDAELKAAGIALFAGLPWYDPETGKRNDRVSLSRLPLQWEVSQAFWDRYIAPLIGPDDTLQIMYGGWPVWVTAGDGEWVRLAMARRYAGASAAQDQDAVELLARVIG